MHCQQDPEGRSVRLCEDMAVGDVLLRVVRGGVAGCHAVALEVLRLHVGVLGLCELVPNVDVEGELGVK